MEKHGARNKDVCIILCMFTVQSLINQLRTSTHVAGANWITKIELKKQNKAP